MPNWGKRAGSSFSNAMTNQQALLQALIAAGEMGLVDKPVQRVGKMDPRRMGPGHAYKPMVQEQAPMVPGPSVGGRAGMVGSRQGMAGIDTMPGAEPTMQPTGRETAPDMGTFQTYGKVPNLNRMLTGAKIGQMGTENEQWKMDYARKYASDQVGEMGSLADPKAYEREWSKGYRIAEVLSKAKAGGIDLSKMTGGAGTPGGPALDVGSEEEEPDINEEVAFLESLSEDDITALLNDPEVDADPQMRAVKEAYLLKHPDKRKSMYSVKGGNLAPGMAKDVQSTAPMTSNVAGAAMSVLGPQMNRARAGMQNQAPNISAMMNRMKPRGGF